ncbi:MAG: Sir2 family NAD-dependent protein deacetylase [Sulfurospirillum sp.]
MAKVVIFSGAGISAPSGISTFRDTGGLWEKYEIEDICSAGCLETNRDETIDFYDKRREDIKDKTPNSAHKMLAAIAEKYPKEIKIITQNVDDMFEKAGCKDVLHLHGFLKEICCEYCSYKQNIGYEAQKNSYKICPKCSHYLRPNIVFFGEPAPRYADLYHNMQNCEMLVVIGTSGNVINTDIFLNNKIKKSILNNLEPSSAIDDSLYSKVLYKSVTQAIDEIIFDIEDFLSNAN